MKILQIYKDYYPPVVGGIEKHINLLSTGLHQRGFSIDVLVSNTSHHYSYQKVNGINVIKAPEWGRFLAAPLNPTFPYLIYKMGLTADILHFHLPNPTAVIAYLLSRLNKPVVVTYHSDIVRQRKMSKVFTPFLEYFLKHCVDRIIATSPQYKRNSRILCKYRKKCDIIPLGIDLDFYEKHTRPDNDIAAIKRQYGPRIILFVGKFRYYKGLTILIQAMKNVDATLLLVGNGPCSKQIRNAIKMFGLEHKIVFLNEVSDRKLAECFQICDIFVLPSIQKSEAFGIVLLEAMTNGKPVISTDLGTGTSFINVHKETGYVVESNNPRKLSEAINLLFSNPDLMKKFGANGKDRVRKNFSSDIMTDRIVTLYNQAVCR